jgi:hypothetical protein
MRVYESNHVAGPYTLYHKDEYKVTDLSSTYKTLEGASAVYFNNTYFVYADNFDLNPDNLPGGQIVVSKGSSLAYPVTIPVPINAPRTTRHGTVYNVTDPVARQKVWKFFYNQSDSENDENSKTAVSPPSKPLNPAIVQRRYSQAPLCNGDLSWENGGAILTVCWSKPASDGGSPITGYDITIRSSAGDVITRRANAESEFYTFWGLYKERTWWVVSIIASNAAGRSGASSYGQIWVEPDAPDGYPFNDIPLSPYSEAIGYLKQVNISSGVGGNQYAPKSFVTRAQMAMFMYRLKGSPSKYLTAEDRKKFNDLTNKDGIPADVMNWLAKMDVSTGDGKGHYLPKNNVTRAQMAMFLYKLSGSPDYTPPAQSPFSDVSVNNGYYKAISWVRQLGIASGTGNGKYSPNANITREQMALFLYRTSPFAQ